MGPVRRCEPSCVLPYGDEYALENSRVPTRPPRERQVALTRERVGYCSVLTRPFSASNRREVAIITSEHAPGFQARKRKLLFRTCIYFRRGRGSEIFLYLRSFKKRFFANIMWGKCHVVRKSKEISKARTIDDICALFA